MDNLEERREALKKLAESLGFTNLGHRDFKRLLTELHETDAAYHSRKAWAANLKFGTAERGLAFRALMIIEDFIGEQFEVLSHLQMALIDVEKGRINPMFATSDNEIARSSMVTLSKLIQANAAALLSYGCVDFALKQQSWANEICSSLAKAGYVKTTTGQPFTADALRQWERACVNGSHPQSEAYQNMLTIHRTSMIPPSEHLSMFEAHVSKQCGGGK